MYIAFFILICMVSSCPVLNGGKSKGLTAIESYLVSSSEDFSVKNSAIKRLPGQHQDHFSDLNMAILEHKTQRVGELLAQVPSASNEQDNEGSSLLQWAAILGYADIVPILLSFNANVDGPESAKYPPLHLACIMNHTEVVMLLLEAGANINLISSQGISPIHHAVDEGLPELSNLLLEHGASIDQREHKSYLRLSLLQIAAMRGEVALTKILLSHGASAKIKDRVGHTALMFACASQHYKIVSLLLSQEDTVSSINSMDNQGGSALIYAIIGEPGSIRGHLIPGGRPSNRSPRSPPHRGAARPKQYKGGKLEKITHTPEEEENICASIVKSLLLHGADSNLAEHSLVNPKQSVPRSKKDSKPPLFHAVRLGYPKVIKYLLQYSAVLPQESITGKVAKTDQWKDLSYYIDWSNTMNRPDIRDLFEKHIKPHTDTHTDL